MELTKSYYTDKLNSYLTADYPDNSSVQRAYDFAVDILTEYSKEPEYSEVCMKANRLLKMLEIYTESTSYQLYILCVNHPGAGNFTEVN
jgi:hypothetical protein